ncbi:MAG TPA: hypothetical protein VLW85_08760, partial [Myxococcales bacterium]|nr:hypothetical protein [Myxococcales bacterium]
TERMYQHRPLACKGSEGAVLSRAMARTKKSIKNRSKTKKQALKRKRQRRNKGLRRGMRAR